MVEFSREAEIQTGTWRFLHRLTQPEPSVIFQDLLGPPVDVLGEGVGAGSSSPMLYIASQGLALIVIQKA